MPGDKSISHRSAIVASLADGCSEITNYAPSDDCLSTLSVLSDLGVEWKKSGSDLTVEGRGRTGFVEPKNVLDCGNSGTTMRLMCGLLAGQPFFSVLTGDESLRSRPMARVIEPLRTMGAVIHGRSGDRFAPLCIRGCRLSGTSYTMPVASAQVKSALLLAGLFAEGCQTVIEKELSRDHTERMLDYFGVSVSREGGAVTVCGEYRPEARKLSIPGDISSAAFFLVLGTLAGEGMRLEDIGVNPTRTGILSYLEASGAPVTLTNQRLFCNEPVADLEPVKGKIMGCGIGEGLIPLLIDELPVIAVAACFASGRTTVTGAAELRVKETDRISAVCTELRKMGASIDELKDGFVVDGPCALHGAECFSHGDHRIAMALTIAGLMAEGETVISGAECVSISFPGFFESVAKVCGYEAITIEK